MKLGEIFDLGIEMAVQADPRGKKEVKRLLAQRKKSFSKLKKKEKEFFDEEKLKHLYDDSRIFTDKNAKIKRALVGIDMETPELLLAKELSRSGKKIDLVWAHHPEDYALKNLDGVMSLQEYVLEKGGLPPNVTEKILSKRIEKVANSLHSINANRVGSAARLLNISFMNTHTITDNLVYDFLDKLIKKKKPSTLGDLVEMLEEIPEYKEAKKIGQGPKIISGSKASRCGKIIPAGMTGGTEGAKEIYERLSISGVGTVVDMHMSNEHLKQAKKNYVNVIIAGHMASDSLGMNLLLDKVEKKGVEIIPHSGLIRVKR